MSNRESRAVMVILDGLGDRPIVRLGGKTPLEAARTPNMDRLAREGITGLMDPLAPGIRVGTDVGHLALFGYDPLRYEIGRGVLEALGIGMELGPGEVVARAPGARGHIECRGLIMDSESRLGTVPVLRTEVSDAELTHEAAIGRLGEEQIFYLMSRGIPEEEAVSVLVRGFMEVETKGLPEELKERVRAALDMAAAGL